MDLGNFSLVAAWLLSMFGLIVGCVGAYKNDYRLIRSARNSVHLVAFFSILSLVILAFHFLKHDYQYVYVWQTSNNAMSPMYLVAAIWGGMDGSMLLWAAMMALFGSLVLFRSKEVSRNLMKWVVPLSSGATGFFLFVVAFLTNPFRIVPQNSGLLDGNGLNPLLQNPSMVIHPPLLYAGFTGFVVPCVFCLAALLSGDLSDVWTRVTRRWTLFAWAFLTAGIILGGNWAYIELGWGGFWAWDPVENASFLPWLTGTAFLHSVLVQQQKGMLKVWNVCLSVLTYGLTVFGTFLTRSGVVQSVHAFAETDIGWVFLLYLFVLFALTAVLISFRWRDLKPDNQLVSYFSREAAFLFNNLIFLAICFATFWGVMFPVITEALGQEKSVVGPPFFNRVNVPLFLILIFLMGVGPLISWRRSSFAALKRLFLKPLLSGSFISILFLFIDSSRPYSAIAFGLSTFVLLTIFSEFYRSSKARKQLSGEGREGGVLALVKRRPRRYGGLIVHLGVLVVTVSITASSAYKIEKDFSLAIGEQQAVGRFIIELEDLSSGVFSNYDVLQAKVKVSLGKNNQFLTYLNPERRFYRVSEEPTTEVAIRVSPREDLYVALAGLEQVETTDGLGRAVFKVFVNPLQVWLWLGGLVMFFGTILVIGFPSKSLAGSSAKINNALAQA